MIKLRFVKCNLSLGYLEGNLGAQDNHNDPKKDTKGHRVRAEDNVMMNERKKKESDMGP